MQKMGKAIVIGASLDPEKQGLTAAICTQLDLHYDVKLLTKHSSLHLDGDVIVITAFDHTDPAMQERLFRSIFSVMRQKENAHIVVIGSTAHYMVSWDTAYTSYKRLLKDAFYELGKEQSEYKCKLTLIEPGQCERVQGKPVSGPFLKFTEVNTTLMFALRHNPKFMHIALRGASY